MKRPRTGFVVALAAGLCAGAWVFSRPRPDTIVLAVTTCPFFGEPVTRLGPGLTAEDTAHVRAHEGVHAQQCRDLGPIRYRLRNLTSKLELEAPAYCAGAAARLGIGLDSLAVRERLHDDALEALARFGEPESIVQALRASCPGITGPLWPRTAVINNMALKQA